jgi:thiol-disulfide isomerase/thioredoxin
MALDPRTVRAPEFPRVEWLNSPDPLIMADFRGRTVLVDLWDFTCINCLRTLPYLRDWHERYQAAGLIIIGVHTPEFAFGRSASLVRSALGRLGVRWPVALDNDQEIWTAYANHAWPTAYLVDADGYLRARHPGDAGYHRLEADLRQLLAGREAAREPLPPIAKGSAADD